MTSVGGVTLNAETNFTFDGTQMYLSGTNNGSTPLLDLRASGTGTFQRGVRLLNSGMGVGDHIMMSIGQADGSRNMGQFYFQYNGANSTSNRISMGLHSVDDVLNILGTGFVGLGTTNPGYRLETNGDVKVTAGALGVNVNPSATDGRIDAGNDVIAYSSDKRLKTNIEVLDNPLNKILKLSGFTYNWNELAKNVANFDTNERLVGVFAQDVKEVLPEAVKLAPFDNDGTDKSKSGEEYLTVQYEKIVPLLIESIRELTKKIEDLEKRIK